VIEMKKLFLALLLLPLTSSATILTEVSACTQDEVSRDPISIVPTYQIPYWQELLNRSGTKEIFNAEHVNAQLRASGITRTDLTSSHVVNLVVDGIKEIELKSRKLVQTGELKPVMGGMTYQEDELASRRASQQAAYKNHLKPLLEDLYRVYTEALEKRLDNQQSFQPSAAADNFKRRVQSQVDTLNAMILQTAPQTAQKLGSIVRVADNNLPFSYHGGYISKIRFRLAGEPHGLTLYPTLLLNQIMNDDQIFLQALSMWKDYCEAQKRMAEKVAASGASGYWEYAKAWTWYQWGSEKQHPDDMIKNLPIKQRAFELASQDLEGAQWVHNKMSTFTRFEIYALLDLFRSLRYDDVPKCQRQLSDLHKRVAGALKGKKSSAELPQSEKEALDRLAKDVVFYADQYKVFSTAGAQKAVENGRKY
jgi:hypothetical protein